MVDIQDDFLSRFYDEDLVQRLSHLPALALDAAWEHYNDKYFNALKGDQIRSSRKSRRNLPIFDIFENVKETIDHFVELESPATECNLVVDRTQPPSYGQYEPYSATIYVGYDILRDGLFSPASKLAVVLAHEYAHHLVFSRLNPVPQLCFRIFHEGVAFGMERVVADTFSEEYQHSAFQHFALKDTIASLESFSQFPKMERDGRHCPLSFSNNVNIHLYGNVLFSVIEAERGQKIYRQILRGEFEW